MADKEPRDMTENELRYHCAAITDENTRLRAALDIARKALLRVERLSEEGRAALSKVSNVI